MVVRIRVFLISGRESTWQSACSTEETLFPGFCDHNICSPGLFFVSGLLFVNCWFILIFVCLLRYYNIKSNLWPSAKSPVAQGCECCDCKDETTEDDIICGLVCHTSVPLMCKKKWKWKISVITQVPNWVQSWNQLSASYCCPQWGPGGSA